MSNLFNITTATNSVALDADRKGKAAFTVSNTSGRVLRARASIMAQDSSVVPWFTIEGQSNRTFAVAGTEQFSVQISAPATAAAGDYTFRLLMVEESNPDENFTEGPGVRVTVPAVVVVAKPAFPWWIIAVAVAVLVIVIAAIAIIVSQNNQGQANASATRTASAVTESARATSSAAAQAQTLAAATTLTAQANAVNAANAATATALALACQPRQFEHDEGNGAFVVFVLPFGLNGATRSWNDGYYTQYNFPLCRGIGWSGLNFTCNRGTWTLNPGTSFYSNALCSGTFNNAQPDMRVGVK